MKKGKYLIILLVMLADQLTKYLIRAGMEPWESKDVLKDFFAITYVQNTGAAFNLFAGNKAVLLAVPFIAVTIGIIYMIKHKNEHWTLHASLSLAIGGGISNAMDRLLMGYVTDMFDFHFWPVFNVADIAICVGCGILVIYVIFFYERKNKTANEAGEV